MHYFFCIIFSYNLAKNDQIRQIGEKFYDLKDDNKDQQRKLKYLFLSLFFFDRSFMSRYEVS